MELREALESAVEEHNEPGQSMEAPIPEASDTPVESASPEPEQPPEEGTDTAAPAPADTPVEKAEVKADTPAPESKALHRIDRAPASWKKEAKGEWASIPLHVRQEVYRREMEVDRVLKEVAPVREQLQQIQQTITPYMARIQSAGVTPVQAMNELFKADYVLATGSRQGKAEMMAKLIKDYDVSIEDLDAAIVASMKGQQEAPQQQGFDPNYVNQLVQQQLQQALAPIYQERQQREQQVSQQAEQTIEQMALDPKYPYFEEVRQEMADLIEVYARRGVALSLQQAYTKAVATNPSISEEQSRQAQMSQATAQHQQAQRAKVAASSVSGAPASGGSQQFAGDGSLRGAIEAAFSGSRV
jgi:hypothetical protein